MNDKSVKSACCGASCNESKPDIADDAAAGPTCDSSSEASCAITHHQASDMVAKQNACCAASADGCGDKDHIQPSAAQSQRSATCCASPTGAISNAGEPSEAGRSDLGTSSTVRYRVAQMDCPTEEKLIRNRLEPMQGIVKLDFDLLGRVLTVHHTLTSQEPIYEALDALKMGPSLLGGESAADSDVPVLSKKLKLLLALSGVTAVAAEVVAWLTGEDASGVVVLLALISISSGGLPTLLKGWIAIKNLTLNIYFLMSIAILGAVLIGKWPEAAMVIFLFGLAEAIEALSLERARDAIRSLTTLVPDKAEINEQDTWVKLPIGQVPLGAKMRVKTGERVPLDAIVSSGTGSLDQAPITGESLPVDKHTGDALYAGSILTSGYVEAQVTSIASESTLARIARSIQEAQSSRAPTQRFVDQFARYYTPAVVVLACAVALLGPLLSGGSWSEWLYEALVMLVIACPCALVVSTPVTVVSGLAASAKLGILIKGGVFLETGRNLKVVALDKTGTLTKGELKLEVIEPLASISREKALHLAASLDDLSTHPIARALVATWKTQQPDSQVLAVSDFQSLEGMGVQGSIDGTPWFLGNTRLMERLAISSAPLETKIREYESAGMTVVIMARQGEATCIFCVADAVRPESNLAVEALGLMHIRTVMLTGDNEATAKTVARSVGIKDARGGLLPQDKLAAITELQRSHGLTGMVGDGINDAPALAKADIGFAMGAAGTATAIETADVAIMDDNPLKIVEFIKLSQRTASVLKQNIFIALALKVIFMLLALFGVATLWMAVFADMGGTLLVVLNGLRLLRVTKR